MNSVDEDLNDARDAGLGRFKANRATDLEGPEPLLRSLPTGEPYPVEALGPLRSAVETAQGRTLAPVAISAASALTMAALAVQGHVDVEKLGGSRCPVSLYSMVMAVSGERKSSCDELFMGYLREYERTLGVEYRKAFATWQNKHALWEGRRSKIIAKSKRGAVCDLDAIARELEEIGPEPAAPPSPDRTSSEPTFEGLVRKLRDGLPSQGIFSDEGGQLLGGYAMNGDNRQKTETAFNDLWQGNPVRRTRAEEGAYALYGRRLSISLMVQPFLAREYLANPISVMSGFMPRFLLCEPETTIGTRLQKNVRLEMKALDAFGARLTQILRTPLPMDAETRELSPRLLKLSPDALQMLASFGDEMEIAQAPGARFSAVTGFASKAAEQAARIAGVLTAWQDLNANAVQAETMAKAIQLARYYLGEALRLIDAANVSAEIERAEALRKWLIETWPHEDIVPSEILQRAPIRALREKPAADAAIEVLVKAGWLVQLRDGTRVRGKRRKRAYQLVRPKDDAL
jgi:hypothetical protein